MKQYTIVSITSNFKKWLVQYVNKISRKCSADNEKIYYRLQIALRRLVVAAYMLRSKRKG